MSATNFSPLFYFLNGAATAGALVCALLFARFWAKTADRLFLIFGISFGLQGTERIAFLCLFGSRAEAGAAFYLIRLAAFLLILVGIWDKNRSRLGEEALGT
jgi:hypothetical protein